MFCKESNAQLIKNMENWINDSLSRVCHVTKEVADLPLTEKICLYSYIIFYKDKYYGIEDSNSYNLVFKMLTCDENGEEDFTKLKEIYPRIQLILERLLVLDRGKDNETA